MDGLLGQIGRGLRTVTDVISSPEARQARIENEAQRQALADAARRREAQAQLRGLLSSGQPIDPNQALGLLAEVSPNVAAQGLLQQIAPQQERAEPADVRALRAIGIDPASPEGREIILGRLATGGADDAMLKQIDLQLKALQLEEINRQRQQEETDAAKARRGLQVDISKTVSNAKELARLNDELEGTFLETGLASDFRRTSAAALAGGLQALGKGGAETRNTVAKFDRFNKLATDFAIGLIERFAGTGAVSQQKFQALLASTVNIGTSPGANRQVIADVLETTLDAADVEGIQLPDRQEIESLVRNLRAEGTGSQIPALSRETPVSGTPSREPDAERAELERLRNQFGLTR